MIRLCDVHYHYRGQGPVLADLRLSIPDGQYVVVCGASGSGKSTFGYLLNGLIPHFFEGDLSGTVEVNGRDTRSHSVSDLFPHLGMVFQNADAQLFSGSVETEIAFGLESLGLSPTEIESRIGRTARLFEIESLLSRSPQRLSGGEKRLVTIAAVCSTDPPILVLDEPYAHLDGQGTQKIRETLRKLHNQGKTVVAMEHAHRGLLEDPERCIVLEKGRVIGDGSASEAATLLHQKQIIPQYSPRPIGPGPDRTPVLRLSKVSCRLEGRKVLRGISLEIGRGEAVALIGKNGAGKTTLLKHLNGLIRPEEGVVSILGKPMDGRDPSELAPFIQLSFQNPHDQFFRFRVEDELEAGCRALQRQDPAWAEELRALFLLQALRDRSPFRLSEGEKKRVALASVLGPKPLILALDEPTAGQDGRFRMNLANLLGSLRMRGVTILVVTHDLPFAQAVADRWVLLEEGEVVADGSPEDPQLAAKLQSLGVSWGWEGEKSG